LVASKAQPSVAVREAVDSLFLCVLCFSSRLLRGFHTCHCTGFDPLGTTLPTPQTNKSTPLPRTLPVQFPKYSNPNPLFSHASRYLELYLPNGSIEIAHTSRYAHATGKSELCILATRPLAPGMVITELKGSMADLTDEEDRELKCATATGQAGIRRDFSVIHSKQLKKNHLFLGPARFVNVSRMG
jgi:histone-lysine N-methyltransferase SUV420H